MDSIAATPVLRPQQTRIAPVFDEERIAPATVAASGTEAAAQQNPKFSDLVAILNPLQNLPVVGTVYRKLTDDVPHPVARALGGLLWGGPLGLVGAIFSYVAEQVSGKNATDLVKSIFDGSSTTAVAEQQPAAGAAADPGAPKQLIPAIAAPAAESAAATSATTPLLARSTPAAAAQPAASPAATPPSANIPETRPRNAATRDLAFYQAHAGSRLPAAATSVNPSGPQAPAQLPSFHRAVTPILGGESLPGQFPGASAAPRVDATAAATAAQTTSPRPESPQDFVQRMRLGIDRYAAQNRGVDALARTPTLDRVE